jgi:hypothetical protein
LAELLRDGSGALAPPEALYGSFASSLRVVERGIGHGSEAIRVIPIIGAAGKAHAHVDGDGYRITQIIGLTRNAPDEAMGEIGRRGR